MPDLSGDSGEVARAFDGREVARFPARALHQVGADCLCALPPVARYSRLEGCAAIVQRFTIRPNMVQFAYEIVPTLSRG